MYEIKIPRQMGKIIKEKRLEEGLTQEQLAGISNTSRSLIYRLEKGATNGIALDKLFKILDTLKLRLAVIDTKGAPKSINAVTVERDDDSSRAEKKRRSSSAVENRKVDSNNSSTRNTHAQFDKELKAIQNIKGFNSKRYIRG